MIRIIIITYLSATFLLAFFSLIRMGLVKLKANRRKLGQDRIKYLQSKGRFTKLPLYSMSEIKIDKALSHVKLSVFLPDNDVKTKYVIICPGGGFERCDAEDEGYPVAARFNELGYAAFVLEYRVRFNCKGYAPMMDLSKAISHITDNADKYNVYTDNYAICGFSVGGNMAGMYGTKNRGYVHYNTIKPSLLMLCYPWTNINHWLEHPYWNIWVGLISLWFTERGNFFMFGRHYGRDNKNSICIQKWIDESYPPTYIFAGSDDVLVPSSHHADVIAQALKKNHIKYRYDKYFRVCHGVGLGYNTEAESWIENAIAFWQTIE